MTEPIKKPRVSRAESAQKKQALIASLQGVYGEVMTFCTGRPPLGVIQGSYQAAIEYKELLEKARARKCIITDSPGRLQARITYFAELLNQFQKYV